MSSSPNTTLFLGFAREMYRAYLTRTIREAQQELHQLDERGDPVHLANWWYGAEARLPPSAPPTPPPSPAHPEPPAHPAPPAPPASSAPPASPAPPAPTMVKPPRLRRVTRATH